MNQIQSGLPAFGARLQELRQQRAQQKQQAQHGENVESGGIYCGPDQQKYDDANCACKT